MQSPIKQHSGLRVRISQSFGVNPVFYSKFKDDFGSPLKGHNGIDLVLGYDPQKMYGSDINFTCKGKVSITIWDNPMSSKGNGVYQDSNIIVGADEKQRFDRWVYWHLMDVDVKIGQEVDINDNAGDMGNSGIVFPEPTIAQPYNGTHLHLGLYPYIFDGTWKKEFANNGFDGAIDPMTRINDLNSPDWIRKNNILEWISEVLEPIRWAIQKISEYLKGRQ